MPVEVTVVPPSLKCEPVKDVAVMPFDAETYPPESSMIDCTLVVPWPWPNHVVTQCELDIEPQEPDVTEPEADVVVYDEPLYVV